MNSCPGSETWIRFLEGGMSSEERAVYEDHLYGCEHCLDVFSQCVEEHALAIPLPDHHEVLIEQLIAVLPRADVRRRRIVLPNLQFGDDSTRTTAAAGKSRLRQTLVHYAVACILTLILTASGAFHQLLIRVDEYTENISDSGHRPISERAAEQASLLLDLLHRAEMEREGDVVE